MRAEVEPHDDIIQTEAEVLEIARQVLGSPPVQTRGNSFLDRASFTWMNSRDTMRKDNR